MEKQQLAYEEKALVALQKVTQEKSEALSKAETMKVKHLAFEQTLNCVGFFDRRFFFLYQKANVKMTLCFCLQEALAKAKAEALRWQMLYKELKLSSGQLRENQLLSDEQLQQLHSQVEVQCSLWTCWMVSSFNENVCNVCVLQQLSRAGEAELREEVVSLTQEKKELQYNICLLEEDNQMLREEIQHLRGKTLRPESHGLLPWISKGSVWSNCRTASCFLDGSNESEDFILQGRLVSEEAEPQLTVRRDSQVEEQLRHTQEKLRLKEREVEWRFITAHCGTFTSSRLIVTVMCFTN